MNWLRARIAFACRHPVEMWSGITAIMWAKWLYWFHHSITGNLTYAWALARFTQEDWEWAAFAVGLFQLATLACMWRWATWAGCGIAAWFWVSMGLFIAFGPTGTPGGMLCLGWGLANIHAVVRSVRLNARS